ncbi:unnamed protein product, partial [Rotaria sp. Silwood2]
NELYSTVTNDNHSIDRLQLTTDEMPIDPQQITDQDAQAENRTAHPMDEWLAFSTNVIMADDDPLGIEDTQPHDREVLLQIIHIRHTYFIINYENGHTNEDATLYIYGNDHTIVLNIENDINIQVMNNNESDASQNVINDQIQSQDIISSTNSGDEDDQILGSESGFESDDEHDSDDDHDQIDETVPITEIFWRYVQNNLSNQTNPINIEPVITNIFLSSNQIMESTMHQTNTLYSKISNPIDLGYDSSAESID